MSKFFLHIHHENPLNDITANRTADALVYFPWVKTARYTTKQIDLIYTDIKHDPIQIFEDEPTQKIFILQGIIFESSNGLKKTDDGSLQTQIIDRYQKNGIGSLCGLNGIYNILVFDKKSSRLQIASDRLGILALYFQTTTNKTAFLTTDINAIKNAAKNTLSINPRGIFDLLHYGYTFESRTILKDVLRLLPNTSYEIENGQMTKKKSFSLIFNEPLERPIDHILDQLEDLYSNAINRQLSAAQEYLFTLSAGKDSRVFSHLLKKAGITPRCVSFGESHHAECYFARWFARELGFPWERLSISQDFYADDAYKAMVMDSFSSEILCPYDIETLSRLPKNFDYLISAFMGDDVFGETIGTWLKDTDLSVKHDTKSIYTSFLNFRQQDTFTDEQLKKLFKVTPADYIAENFLDGLALFKGQAGLGHQMAYAYETRTSTRMKIGSILRIMSGGVPLRLPVIDNDLMDFTSALSPSYWIDRKLLDFYIAKRARSLGEIPFDHGGKYYVPLVANRKNEFKIKLWKLKLQTLKFPLLSITNPVAATTQIHKQLFNQRSRGFKKMIRQAAEDAKYLEGIMDVALVRLWLADNKLTNRQKRCLVSVIYAAKFAKE